MAGCASEPTRLLRFPLFTMPSSSSLPSTAAVDAAPAAPAPWRLPSGLRATRATRALVQLYAAQPDAACSVPEVDAALAAAGVVVNKVTVYRLLDRFAAAGLLHKQVDAARVTRYARPADDGRGADVPRFECGDCHRHFRLAQGAAKVQTALQQMLAALASAGHESLAVDIAVRGRCARCAHPAEGLAA
jgi:Fur family ferric uptake transcriptional regulator